MNELELKLRIEAFVKGLGEVKGLESGVKDLTQAASTPLKGGVLNQMDPLAAQAKEAGKELGVLLNKLDPMKAHVQAFARDMALLAQGKKDGTLKANEYAQALDRLDRMYQNLEGGARKAAAAIEHGTAVQNEGNAGAQTFREGLQHLVTAAVGLLTLREGISLLKEAATSAMDAGRQIGQVGLVLRATGQDAEFGVAALEAHTERMIKLGQADDDTRASVLRLLPVAGNMENAIKAQKLAFDVAIATGRDYGTVVGGIERLMNGSLQPINSVRGGLYGLGVDASTCSGALEGLTEKFGGAAEKMDDDKMAIDHVKASMKEFLEQSGSGMLLFLHDAANLAATWKGKLDSLNPALKATVALLTAPLDAGTAGFFLFGGGSGISAAGGPTTEDLRTAKLDGLAAKHRDLIAELGKYQSMLEYVGPGLAFKETQAKIDETKGKLAVLKAEMQRTLNASKAELEGGGAPALGAAGQEAEAAAGYQKRATARGVSASELTRMIAEMESLRSKTAEGTESWDIWTTAIDKAQGKLDALKKKAEAAGRPIEDLLKQLRIDAASAGGTAADKVEARLKELHASPEIIATARALATKAEEEKKAAADTKTHSEAVKKTLEALQSEAGTIGMNARDKMLLALATNNATDAELKLAGVLYDADQKAKLAADIRQHQIELQNSEARRLEALGQKYRDLLNPLNEVTRALMDLAKVRAAGLLGGISDADYAKLAKMVSQTKTATDDMKELWKNMAQGMQKSLAEFLYDPFKDGLKGMLSSFVDMVRKMVAEALAAAIMKKLFGAATGAAGGGGGGGWLSMIMGAMQAGSGHTGAIIGRESAQRTVSPLVFLGAPRFHAGELLGLKPGEVPFIGLEDEEVLSRNDPRNVINGGKNGGKDGGKGGGQGVRILNILDPDMVRDYMNSGSGERVILNIIQRNPGAIRQILQQG